MECSLTNGKVLNFSAPCWSLSFPIPADSSSDVIQLTRNGSPLLSVCMDGDRAGLAFVDVSTGEFQLYEIERASVRLQDEIVRMMPKEIIANTALPENATTLHVDVQDGARF